MPGTPAWLHSQLEYRDRTAAALGAAADQMNVCLQIASDLNAAGRDHTSDPGWQAAVAESHRLADASGHDDHTIGAEATRRRAETT